MQLCPCVIFPLKKTFNQEVLLNLVERQNKRGLPILAYCISTIVSFDL
jgi:hypothetical protein